MAGHRYVLEKPVIKERIFALVLEGKSDAEIAEALATPKRKLTRQAITAFRHRHEAELTPIVAEVERQVTDFAIAQKVNRIAAKELRWSLLEEVRRHRAAGGHGMETGLVVRQYKALGSGKNMQIVEEYKIDPELLAALDRVEHGAAEELAQLPKPEGTGIQVNVGVQVNLRWDDGEPA